MMPSTALPLAYYLCAYLGLGGALLVLAIDPALPGASFYQPRFVALVHLLTLPWLTGSILGSFYIVGPLALRVPMRVRTADWLAFISFVAGASGMVAHFWINTYDGMAWSAVMVTATIAWVGVRMLYGLQSAKVPTGVTLHVALAFFNIVAAAALGMLIGFDRSRGFLSVSPLSTMFAHAHIAAVGWVTMLVIGLSYRLIPMILPAAMPSSGSIAVSAILIQSGLAVLTVCLLWNVEALWAGALMIVAGLASFMTHVRRMVSRRLPRPPALPRRDWSTWQVHMAFAWLAVAMTIGLALSIGSSGEQRMQWMWMYGVAGLLGFLAQMVAGMQGRLVPLYAWYRAYAAAGATPPRAASTLLSATFARSIFLCWAGAIPLLAWGLPRADQLLIRMGAALLLGGLVVGGTYIAFIVRAARGPALAAGALTPASPRTIPHYLSVTE